MNYKLFFEHVEINESCHFQQLRIKEQERDLFQGTFVFQGCVMQWGIPNVQRRLIIDVGLEV